MHTHTDEEDGNTEDSGGSTQQPAAGALLLGCAGGCRPSAPLPGAGSGESGAAAARAWGWGGMSGLVDDELMERCVERGWQWSVVRLTHPLIRQRRAAVRRRARNLS